MKKLKAKMKEMLENLPLGKCTRELGWGVPE